MEILTKNTLPGAVGEAAAQAPILSPQAAVLHILAQRGDPAKFKQRRRGYVDWKFGELAEYLGYDSALSYVQSVQSWFDYADKFADSLLIITFAAFQEARQPSLG
jgi:hypothetical protein